MDNPAPIPAKTPKTYERMRRFSRHRLDGRIEATVFRQGVTSTRWGRTSELGQDGMGAILNDELQVGEVVSLEFSIPAPPHLLKVRAAVRYSDGLRCGFEFLILTDEQKKILSKICASLPLAS